MQRLLQLLPQGVVLSVASDISSLSAGSGTGPRRNSLQLGRGASPAPGALGAPSPSLSGGPTRLAASAAAGVKVEQQQG